MANRFFLVVYDIPQAAGIENPSAYFRRFGVWINLSCWITAILVLVILVLAIVSVTIGCINGDFGCTLVFVFGTFGHMCNLIPVIIAAIVEANQ